MLKKLLGLLLSEIFEKCQDVLFPEIKLKIPL